MRNSPHSHCSISARFMVCVVAFIVTFWTKFAAKSVRDKGVAAPKRTVEVNEVLR